MDPDQLPKGEARDLPQSDEKKSRTGNDFSKRADKRADRVCFLLEARTHDFGRCAWKVATAPCRAGSFVGGKLTRVYIYATY